MELHRLPATPVIFPKILLFHALQDSSRYLLFPLILVRNLPPPSSVNHFSKCSHRREFSLSKLVKSSVPRTALPGLDFSFQASNLHPPHIYSSLSSTYICNLHFYYWNLGAPFEAISIYDLEETEIESNFKGTEFNPPTQDGSSNIRAG